MRTRLTLVGIGVLLFAAVATAQDRPRQPERRPTIQEQIDALRQEILALAERIAALEASRRDKQDQPEPEAPQDAQAADVEREFRNGKLAIGMTLRQVQQLAGSRGKMDSAVGNVQRYTFVVPRSKPLIRDNRPNGTQGTYLIYADFEDGKLVAFSTD